MRVLVAADAMAGVGPRDASDIIGAAFAEAGAQVAVVPLVDGGPWFPDAVAAFDATGVVEQPATMAEALDALASPASTATRLYLDLTGLARHTWAELVAVGPQRLDALRDALAGRELMGVVRSGQQGAALTGLTGVVAERGRTEGADLGDTLNNDSIVSAWLEQVGVDGATPGAGAADGLGAVVVALGGRVSSGIEVCVAGFDVAATMAQADLTVTGASVLDFHAVGGDVVKEVARLSTDALRPVIAIVGRNFVSSRELRLAGIESAHPILEGAGADEPIPAQVGDVAARVARSWIW
ncbi:MAG: glycerate kinase [Arachnia sp.]